MAVASTLPYYDKATIMATKSFIVQAPRTDSQHSIFFKTYKWALLTRVLHCAKLGRWEYSSLLGPLVIYVEIE